MLETLTPQRAALLLLTARLSIPPWYSSDGSKWRALEFDESKHPRDDHGRFSFSDLTPVGGQLGSNEGGTFVDKSGKKYYVKNYKDPSQAAGEHVANAVYKAVGARVPETTLGPNGKLASVWMHDAGPTLAQHGVDRETANKILDHFAADVLTANWDTVGTGHDNILVSKTGGVTRVDQGGTLLHRAQGALKPEAVLHNISEWDRLPDPSTNPYYAKVFQAAGIKNANDLGQRIVKQVADIDKARPKAGWESFVRHAAPNAPKGYAEKVGKLLEARHKLLQEKAAQIAGRVLGEWNEALHPRDDHGKFSDSGGGVGGGASSVKKMSPAASKDQIKTLVEMKKAGKSIKEIQDATGIGPAQANNILAKHANAEKAIEEVLKEKPDYSKFSGKATMKQDEDTKKWVVKDANGKVILEKDTKGMAQAHMDLYNNKSFAAKTLDVAAKLKPPVALTKAEQAAKQGYVWQEKTSLNSPGLKPENAGKYAYFKDGTQVSAPFSKGDAEKAVDTLHSGKGLPPEPKPFVIGKSEAGKWPIDEKTQRLMGQNTPVKLQEIGNEWSNKLNHAEGSAIESYTGSGYGHINSVLRNNPDKMEGSALKIKSAIDKHPAPPPPELVWRGISHNIGTLNSGDVIQLNGFQSTSINPEFAHGWSGYATFEIKPSKGAYVRPISSHKHEYEYLLPHGAKYTVVGTKYVKLGSHQTNVIQLEMHP